MLERIVMQVWKLREETALFLKIKEKTNAFNEVCDREWGTDIVFLMDHLNSGALQHSCS